jgi:hypothetical protein
MAKIIHKEAWTSFVSYQALVQPHYLGKSSYRYMSKGYRRVKLLLYRWKQDDCFHCNLLHLQSHCPKQRAFAPEKVPRAERPNSVHHNGHLMCPRQLEVRHRSDAHQGRLDRFLLFFVHIAAHGCRDPAELWTVETAKQFGVFEVYHLGITC